MDSDALTAAVKALTDAFASGDVVLACVAAGLIAAVVVLKFLGKKVPFVDVGVSVVLDLVKRLAGGRVIAPGVKAVVEPVKADADAPKDATGAGNVVNIKKDS